MHPAPFVTHPDKKVSHSASVVAVVLSEQALTAQVVLAAAVKVFQHLTVPLVPLKASH